MKNRATHGALDTSQEPRAATPVAGAIAGILFAVLFSAEHGDPDHERCPSSRGTPAHGSKRARGRSSSPSASCRSPGSFFLWFIAVARERLGSFEDQFFSTVFLGSGLLFLAMMFAAAASAGAIVAAYSRNPSEFAGQHHVQLRPPDDGADLQRLRAAHGGRLPDLAGHAVDAHRGHAEAAGLPHYVVALVLLFVITQSIWVVLVFPAWVFLVSVYILVTHLRSGAKV